MARRIVGTAPDPKVRGAIVDDSEPCGSEYGYSFLGESGECLNAGTVDRPVLD